MLKHVGSRAFIGGARGALYGITGGFLLGAVGNVFSDGLSTVNVMVWKDQKGQTKKFTHLDVLESFDIYKDLSTLMPREKWTQRRLTTPVDTFRAS